MVIILKIGIKKTNLLRWYLTVAFIVKIPRLHINPLAHKDSCSPSSHKWASLIKIAVCCGEIIVIFICDQHQAIYNSVKWNILIHYVTLEDCLSFIESEAMD